MTEIIIYPDNSMVIDGCYASSKEADYIFKKYNIPMKRKNILYNQEWQCKTQKIGNITLKIFYNEKLGKIKYKYKQSKIKKTPPSFSWWKRKKKGITK